MVGLFIPDKSKRRPTTGTIVAICPDQQADLGHWVGKRIVFARWSGTGLNFKNRPAFRVLDIQEILAELTETDAELDLDDTSLDQQ
jgi:co-chaperonin GroES (HSP10)